MWIPEQGVAQLASWRLAALLRRHHSNVEIRWKDGPMGLDYDVMELTGTGRAGPFHLLVNRTGTIQCWLEDGTGNDPELLLGWDEVLQRDRATHAPGLDATVARIEQVLGLARDPGVDDPRSAFPVDVVARIVGFHVGAGRAVRTEGVWIGLDDEEPIHADLGPFVDLVEDVHATQLGRDVPADQVWVLSVDDAPAVALHLPSALGWAAGRRGPLDLLEVAESTGTGPLDADATAAWLVGPQRDHDAYVLTAWPRPRRWPAPTGTRTVDSTTAVVASTAAPQGEFGMGVVEAVDEMDVRFVVLAGSLGYDDRAEGRTEGPWVTSLIPLEGEDRVFHSRRPPVAGPDDPHEGLHFHRRDRAHRFRALRDDDAAWVSRFDVDLSAHDLRLLVSLLGELKDELEDPDVEFQAAREAAEELVALVAQEGTVVFALHYMLLDGRRVVNPQFRDEGDWSDEIPYLTDPWQSEARRVITEGLATPDPEHLIDDEPPTNDPFMLLGVAEYLQVHPTMARAFMELFDSGHPIPASIARLAEGDADDLVRPGGAGGWESEPWGSDGSPSSDVLRRRTEPMRRIDLMQVLYDISLQFSSRR